MGMTPKQLAKQAYALINNDAALDVLKELTCPL